MHFLTPTWFKEYLSHAEPSLPRDNDRRKAVAAQIKRFIGDKSVYSSAAIFSELGDLFPREVCKERRELDAVVEIE